MTTGEERHPAGTFTRIHRLEEALQAASARLSAIAEYFPELRSPLHDETMRMIAEASAAADSTDARN